MPHVPRSEQRQTADKGVQAWVIRCDDNATDPIYVYERAERTLARIVEYKACPLPHTIAEIRVIENGSIRYLDRKDRPA